MPIEITDSKKAISQYDQVFVGKGLQKFMKAELKGKKSQEKVKKFWEESVTNIIVQKPTVTRSRMSEKEVRKPEMVKKTTDKMKVKKTVVTELQSSMSKQAEKTKRVTEMQKPKFEKPRTETKKGVAEMQKIEKSKKAELEQIVE